MIWGDMQIPMLRRIAEAAIEEGLNLKKEELKRRHRIILRAMLATRAAILSSRSWSKPKIRRYLSRKNKGLG